LQVLGSSGMIRIITFTVGSRPTNYYDCNWRFVIRCFESLRLFKSRAAKKEEQANTIDRRHWNWSDHWYGKVTRSSWTCTAIDWILSRRFLVLSCYGSAGRSR
jgi:hypothetical protein